MGRSLHYAVYDDPKNYREAEREIRIAQELLIYRFTWSCEWPSLSRCDESERSPRISETVLKRTPDSPCAEGYTKVAGDEWNALLITRFATWLSRRLPTATITLRDEGDYLVPGYQILRAGAPELDLDRLAESRAYLTKHGMQDYLVLQAVQIEAFKRGETHSPVRADGYAERREIRALGLSPDVLARMTLDEVADAMTFPWTTEGLRAA